ncbi:MAG TPA: sialidase family protein [Candidatus Limnocylindria bacterium]|nr:sialidase family protein [Candidatus Limnocylindria bacterium]
MKRFGVAIAVICTLIWPTGALATSVVSIANISNDGPADNGDNEVDIAINPTNTQNLIAAWNDYGPGDSCGLGYSMNGGRTWRTSWLPGITAAGGNPTFDYGGGDPSVGFLNDGTAVLSCASWGASKSQPSAVWSSRSTDGGRTWEAAQQLTFGLSLGHLQDHNMLTIDRYGNRALVAYTVWNGYRSRSFALISSDGGQTYAGPYEIAADYKRNAVDRFDVSLAGAPDGTIYATSGIWQFVNEWNEQAVVVSQMRPGETAFTRSVKVRDLVPAPFNLPGESWRTSMQASIGVEADGTVDLLTGDFVTGNLDMYLARSTDHGLSFPSQVNLTNDVADQVMPWMSIAPNGRIDTIFYDYNRSTGLMDAVYGQTPAKGSTLARTVVQTGIDGDAQPPRGEGHTPFMGDYLGVDSTDTVVAVSWTGNGPLSQDVYSAVLAP